MDLHLDLARAPGNSLRTRLEHCLREAMRDGRLAPGARLPSTRVLCLQLGVSRGVVVDAYSQLVAEGYLRGRQGAGTSVAATLRRPSSALADRGALTSIRHDLNPFRPALDGFPRRAWSSAVTHVLRSVSDDSLGYPDPAGVPQLRETMARYLGRVRGVQASPDQVLVTAGTRHGLWLVWRALASAGVRAIAIERPGWAGVGEIAADAGLSTVQLPVDRDGLVVERLAGVRVEAVVVAPAHQYPTGAVLSPSRRARLVSWARERRALIVEDDYDAEYRYDRHPVGSLQGLEPERVVYLGSTSKTLAPAIGVGWLVAPRRLIDSLVEIQRRSGGPPTPLHQLALARLIERGDLDRHLRSQRRRYARTRELLLAALARELTVGVVSGAAAGLYVTVALPVAIDERLALVAARSRGIAVEGGGGATPTLVVGYANLSDAAVAPAVRALAASVREAAACGA